MKRLIDAEKLKDELRSLGWFEDDDEFFTSCLEDIIDEQPTITNLPIIKGEWIDIDDGWNYQCSNCNFYYAFQDNPLFKYCPECGTKMK